MAKQSLLLREHAIVVCEKHNSDLPFEFALEFEDPPNELLPFAVARWKLLEPAA